MPLLSIAVPGLDQWWEGQYTDGLIYSGYAGLGAFYGKLAHGTHSDIGFQMFQTAGFMSAYHGFRAAAQSRKERGEFNFLPEEESPEEIALAPFHFSYLSRMTTLIPLTLAFGVGFLGYDSRDTAFRSPSLNLQEAYFASAQSYQAGLGEEALFRGYLMPLSKHYTGSTFVSNLMTNVIFAALHTRENFIPWPQFVAGLYLGYLTEKNNWSIGESIFVHCWYDFFLFLGDYVRNPNEFSVQLPPLVVRF